MPPENNPIAVIIVIIIINPLSSRVNSMVSSVTGRGV